MAKQASNLNRLLEITSCQSFVNAVTCLCKRVTANPKQA